MKIGLLRELKDIKENISFNLETPISEIAAVIKDKSIGAVPIVDDQNRLIGIVSERDIVTKMVVEARDADLTTAQEIMTKEIISGKGTSVSKVCIHFWVFTREKVIAIFQVSAFMVST